jgi:hypothetical protein
MSVLVLVRASADIRPITPSLGATTGPVMLTPSSSLPDPGNFSLRRRAHLLTQFESPKGATVTPRVPPRSMNCCTAPEFGLLDELAHVGTPIRLAFRDDHSVDVCAVAVRKHTRARELRREAE